MITQSLYIHPSIDHFSLTCSSVIQVQCQKDCPVNLTKNSLSALPFMGGGRGASGGASGAGGTGMGGGGSPHRQWRIFWTRPLIGGHWEAQLELFGLTQIV